jgi:c-di-GMP-binding flagellar brake protein YcgR
MLEQDKKPEVIDDEKYSISSKAGILAVLRLMIRNKSLASCAFGDRDNFFPTVLLSLDVRRDEMVLDYGPDEEINRQALKADKWNIVAFPNQVKVHFSCQQIRKIELEGRSAFLTEIPKSLLRMQKREYYRVVIPAIAPVKCMIPLLDPEPPVPVQVVLENISCGGMTFIDREYRADFEVGAVYENCVITLPGVGTAKASIKIRRVELGHASRLAYQRVSCEFIDTEENRLPLIQRYVIKLELERKRNVD